MRGIGHEYHLPRIGWVGENLLISSVRGVEYNLSRGFADMTESRSFVD